MPLFTVRELQKLKAAKDRYKPSRYRKKTYAIWHCDACLFGVYYKVLKCVLCTGKVKERRYQSYFRINDDAGAEIIE